MLRDWLQNEELVTVQPHYTVQDQAPSHFARLTREQMAAWGMRSMNNPATSPDLNLAENPIGQLKYNIVNRRDGRPTSIGSRNFGRRTTVITRSITQQCCYAQHTGLHVIDCGSTAYSVGTV